MVRRRDGLDNTRGKVTFAVEAEWGDEHYTWHVKEQDMNPTIAPLIEARVREARAEAWAGGFNAATDVVPEDVWFGSWSRTRNPYRDEESNA